MPLSTWWSVPQALVWISTGDESVVDFACANGASISVADVYASLAANERQSPRNTGTWNAQEAFCEACAAGEISCRGHREGEGPTEIPAEEWSHLAIQDSDDRGPIRAAVERHSNRDTWWVDLVVRADAARHRWPVESVSEPPSPSAIETQAPTPIASSASSTKSKRRRAPSQADQLTLWLVQKGKEYIEIRSRNDLAADFKAEKCLNTAVSVRTVDRAKSHAVRQLEERQVAPSSAK